MELTRLITGEFYAGYLEEDYKKPLNHDSGFNFGADFKWGPHAAIGSPSERFAPY